MLRFLLHLFIGRSSLRSSSGPAVGPRVVVGCCVFADGLDIAFVVTSPKTDILLWHLVVRLFKRACKASAPKGDEPKFINPDVRGSLAPPFKVANHCRKPILSFEKNHSFEISLFITGGVHLDFLFSIGWVVVGQYIWSFSLELFYN